MWLIKLGLIMVACLFDWAAANVEKTIFIPPEPVAIPQDAAISNLLLEPLHFNRLSVRTHLNASFPSNDKPHGQDTWALLEGLTPGQRYELRVCWLATQPTTFTIDTFSLSETFETANLITSLTEYSYARHAQLPPAAIATLQANRMRLDSSTSTQKSLLFLRIQAAADYFTLNKTLMENVPPVHADLILDPFIFNLFPHSLVPTAGYIAVIAVAAWFLSGWIYKQMMAYVDQKPSTKRDGMLADTKKSR